MNIHQTNAISFTAKYPIVGKPDDVDKTVERLQKKLSKKRWFKPQPVFEILTVKNAPHSQHGLKTTIIFTDEEYLKDATQCKKVFPELMRLQKENMKKKSVILEAEEYLMKHLKQMKGAFPSLNSPQKPISKDLAKFFEQIILKLLFHEPVKDNTGAINIDLDNNKFDIIKGSGPETDKAYERALKESPDFVTQEIVVKS